MKQSLEEIKLLFENNESGIIFYNPKTQMYEKPSPRESYEFNLPYPCRCINIFSDEQRKNFKIIFPII